MAISIKPTVNNITNSVAAHPQSVAQKVDKKRIDAEFSPKERDQSSNVDHLDGNKLKEATISRDTIEAAVKKLNDFVASNKRNINFTIDDDTGRTVVKLMDSENNVLRQIPSEEVLRVLKSLEKNKGLFLEDHA